VRITECFGCGEAIFFARTGSGSKIPIDVEPNSAGTFVVEHAETPDPQCYRLSNDAAATYTGDKYVPHWETCPKAKDFKKR
jgi:hypothetical protein